MDISGIGNSTNNNSVSSATAAKEQSSDSSFETMLQNAVKNNDADELKKACHDFEGIIMSMMYKEMRATVPKSDLLPDDNGMDIFQSMLDDQLMTEASKNQSLGLADILYKQLSGNLKSEDKSKSTDNTGATDEKNIEK